MKHSLMSPKDESGKESEEDSKFKSNKFGQQNTKSQKKSRNTEN